MFAINMKEDSSVVVKSTDEEEKRKKRREYQKEYYRKNRTRILAMMTKRYHDNTDKGEFTRPYKKAWVGPIYSRYEGNFTLHFA